MQNKPNVLIYAPWYEPAMDRLDEIAITHHLYKAVNKENFLAQNRIIALYLKDVLAIEHICLAIIFLCNIFLAY